MSSLPLLEPACRSSCRVTVCLGTRDKLLCFRTALWGRLRTQGFEEEQGHPLLLCPCQTHTKSGQERLNPALRTQQRVLPLRSRYLPLIRAACLGSS